jgi:regulator of sirC expression with transglutaminase-like and TPR domain
MATSGSGSTTNPPSGGEKSLHWSKDRLHADITKAVGGVMNLVREVARVSHKMDEAVPAEWMVKRAQFMSYELQTLARNAQTEIEKLGVLNHFFFEEKNFRCVTDFSRVRDATEAFRLNRVFNDRTGAPIVLELLYAYLAEKIGVKLEFVDLKPTCFLKWCEKGRSRFIDITRGGATLSSDELIETLQTRFRITSFTTSTVLDAYTFESFVGDYVSALKRACGLGADAGSTNPEKLLFLQDTLIAYQPSNLHLVGERALLQRRLGNFKGALSDLKRYFAFHDRARAPGELVRLYDELVQLLERTKTNIEVID